MRLSEASCRRSFGRLYDIDPAGEVVALNRFPLFHECVMNVDRKAPRWNLVQSRPNPAPTLVTAPIAKDLDVKRSTPLALAALDSLSGFEALAMSCYLIVRFSVVF